MHGEAKHCDPIGQPILGHAQREAPMPFHLNGRQADRLVLPSSDQLAVAGRR